MELKEISIDQLVTSKLNPRLDLGQEDFDELVASIKGKGIVEALVVRKKDDKYEIVSGERRYRAAQKARKKTVQCIVKKLTDVEAIEESLIGNAHRKDFTPIEKATAIRYMLSNYKKRYPTQQTLADALGIHKSTLSVWLNVLDEESLPRKLSKRATEYITGTVLCPVCGKSLKVHCAGDKHKVGKGSK